MRLVEVGSHALAQLAAGVRGGRLGPRGDDDCSRIARLERKPAGLGGLGRAGLGIAESERRGAAERECLRDSPVERRRLDALEDSEGAGRITELDRGEGFLCLDLLRLRLAGDARGGGVGRRRTVVPEGVECFRSQAACVAVVRGVIQQRCQVAERIGERPQLHRLPGGSEQPVDGLLRPASLEPMTGDQARRRTGARQALRRLAVDGEPVVRWELLDQGLADQVVTEAVARGGDDEDPPRSGQTQYRALRSLTQAARDRSSVGNLLALRPERLAQVRMPPTAQPAPRGERPGPTGF